MGGGSVYLVLPVVVIGWVVAGTGVLASVVDGGEAKAAWIVLRTLSVSNRCARSSGYRSQSNMSLLSRSVCGNE